VAQLFSLGDFARMDKSELIKTAVTAVIAVCARELVGFIIRQSKTAAATLKAVAVVILKRHWMIVPVIFDSLFLVYLVWFFISPLVFDRSPATKQDVVICALASACAVDVLNHLRKDLLGYVISLRRPVA